MGKKELKKIIEKRVLSGEHPIYTGDGCEACPQDELFFLCRQLGMLCESGLPFYYSKTNHSILIIDHVTFDSAANLSGQEKNFSDMFLKKQRRLRKAKKNMTGNFKMLPPVFRGPGSARGYLMNCALAFRQHYALLNEYKTALREEGVCLASGGIKTCFFMEDITPLGSYILNPDGMDELVLFYVKQFLDLFERSPDLDYVFFGNFKGRSDALWFMSKKNIQCYRTNEMDILRKNYFSFDVKRNTEI
jgi:hypothetical protein